MGVDIEQYDQERPDKYLRGLWQKETNLSIVKAYRSYFSIVASTPINFINFTRLVNEYRQKPPFNFANPLAHVGGIVQVTTRDDENYERIFYSLRILHTHVCTSHILSLKFSLFL